MGRRRVTGTLSSVVFSVTVLCIAASPIFAAPTYSITDLGTLGGTGSWAAGLNNSGQVAGYANYSTAHGSVHAFLWSPGGTPTMTDLTPTVSQSYGYGINNSGQVTGWTYRPSGLEEAFRYSAGTMDYLGTLQYHSLGHGINDLGQVVGYSYLSASYPYPYHAFLYTDGTGMTDLGTMGGTFSCARDTNNLGQVVGYSYINSITVHAFLRVGSTWQDLGTLPGWTNHSYAHSLNENGQVVGYSVNNTGNGHAFLWQNNAMTDLGTLGGSYSVAWGINGSGQVVGWGNPVGDAAQHAFLWSEGSMVDLNTYVTGTGWTLNDAEGINDWGDICGTGTNPDGKTHAYLLTRTDVNRDPTTVPEPSLAGLLLIATVPALVVYRRRRRA